MLYNQWKYNRAKYSTADLEDGVAVAPATSSTSCEGYVFNYIEGSADCIASSTTTSDSQRLRESGSLVLGDTVVSVVYVRKRNTSMISFGQSGSSSNCVRVIDASATVNSSATSTSSSERIRGSDATSLSESSINANANAIYSSSGLITASSTTTAICNKVMSFSAVSAGVTVTITIGREKWEVISPTATTWTTVAA